MDGSDSAANGSPQPRLCHVVKVDTFDGYGFNLLAEQGRPGQYIGKVDEGSPAEHSGLRQGDKILEVNGVSILNDNHKQVVQKIKAIAGETKLLVVTPSPNDKVPQMVPQIQPQSQLQSQPQSQPQPQPPKVEEQPAIEKKPAEIKKAPIAKEKESPKEERERSELNLGMSVAEMRAQIAAKKRADPKKVPMDFKSKFEIVKQL